MLPHIRNSQAGVNRMEPLYNNMFEVYFTIPAALQAQYGSDVAVLTEQVQSIEGLGSLDKSPETVEQKFMGTTRTYLKSKLDTTSHELTIKLALNLRKGTDNFVRKLFRAWRDLCYNPATGETSLKVEYVADWLKVVIANRAGDIYRDILYKDVILAGPLEGLNALDYTNEEIQDITVKLRSDWAEDKEL
jgi:hypothetical protein